MLIYKAWTSARAQNPALKRVPRSYWCVDVIGSDEVFSAGAFPGSGRNRRSNESPKNAAKLLSLAARACT